MSEYGVYYRLRGGQPVGPLTVAYLRLLAGKGGIDDRYEVSLDGGIHWLSVTSFLALPEATALPKGRWPLDTARALWRGELETPQALAWGWVIPRFLLGALATLIIVWLPQRYGWETRYLASVSLPLLMLGGAVVFWQVIGLLRCGMAGLRATPRRYGGAFLWLVALVQAGQAFFIAEAALPAVRTFALLAMGEPVLGGSRVSVSQDGTVLYIGGAIEIGTHDRVRAALKENAAIRSVFLSGPGGFMLEAQRIQAEIRERNLETVVLGECLSACAYVYIAGIRHTFAREARLGFHRPHSPLEALSSERVYKELARSTLVPYELATGFIERVISTPGDRMWFPTLAELQQNGLADTVVDCRYDSTGDPVECWVSQ